MQKNPKPLSGKPSVAIQNSANSAHPAHPASGDSSSVLPIPRPDIDFDENELKFPETRPGSYRAALAFTGRIIPLPIIVAFITALLYIAIEPPNGNPDIGTLNKIGIIIGGIAITVGIWFVTSLFCMDLTTFAGANEQSSNHLKRHLLTLYSILQLIKERTDPDSKTYSASSSLVSFRNKSPEDYDLAFLCAYENICGANKQIKINDATIWIRGTGYIKVWNFVHIAEEAILNIAPREFVIREALHDEAAINGSDIALHDTILSNIKMAVKKLSPSAGIYLKSLPAQDRNITPDNSSINDHTAPVPANDASVAASKDNYSIVVDISRHPIKRLFARSTSNTHSSVTGEHDMHNTHTTHNKHNTHHAKPVELDVITEIEARNALRDARQTLNDFRASQWDGLVRLRNQIFGTSLFTAILTYALLCAAIISGVDVAPLKAALFFYLVGATVGLFSRLYTERQSDSAIDDYDLTVARVTVTPIVSGLAAIAGVLLVSFLSLNLFNTPGSSNSIALPPLRIIYDLVANQQGIVIAAIFGFAPNLLLNALQQKANDATTKLKNSSAPGSRN